MDGDNNVDLKPRKGAKAHTMFLVSDNKTSNQTVIIVVNTLKFPSFYFQLALDKRRASNSPALLANMSSVGQKRMSGEKTFCAS